MDDKDRNAKIMDAKGLGVSEVCAIAFFYRLLPPLGFSPGSVMERAERSRNAMDVR